MLQNQTAQTHTLTNLKSDEKTNLFQHVGLLNGPISLHLLQEMPDLRLCKEWGAL